MICFYVTICEKSAIEFSNNLATKWVPMYQFRDTSKTQKQINAHAKMLLLSKDVWTKYICIIHPHICKTWIWTTFSNTWWKMLFYGHLILQEFKLIFESKIFEQNLCQMTISENSYYRKTQSHTNPISHPDHNEVSIVFPFFPLYASITHIELLSYGIDFWLVWRSPMNCMVTSSYNPYIFQVQWLI